MIRIMPVVMSTDSTTLTIMRYRYESILWTATWRKILIHSLIPASSYSINGIFRATTWR